MCNYSTLWEKKLITNLRLASNQSRSCLVALPGESESHLQSHNMVQTKVDILS